MGYEGRKAGLGPSADRLRTGTFCLHTFEVCYEIGNLSSAVTNLTFAMSSPYFLIDENVLSLSLKL